MTDKHDFKSALDGLLQVDCDRTLYDWYYNYCLGDNDRCSTSTIAIALRIAERLQIGQVISDKVKLCLSPYGCQEEHIRELYTALIKECEDEQ